MVQLRSLGNEQTLFLSTTNWSTNSFASLPVTNLPPGYALVTVFVNGIPSTSEIVFVAPTPGPITLVQASRQLGGAFQFGFTNTVGAIFTVLASGSLSSPPSNWTVLGSATETADGRFQFTDAQAGHFRYRLYRVRSP